jgi:prophage maintenance system killer protein
MTRDQVIRLHDEGIKRYGGDPTPRGDLESCIDRSLGAAWNGALYREPVDAAAGLCFAAFLLFYLTKNQCFTDGNKRTGWLAGVWVLLALGLTVTASKEECEIMVRSIAAEAAATADDVVRWLAPRVESVT